MWKAIIGSYGPYKLHCTCMFCFIWAWSVELMCMYLQIQRELYILLPIDSNHDVITHVQQKKDLRQVCQYLK